jgi:anti-sigma B factor antagonist
MDCTATVRRIGDITVIDLNGRFTIAEAPGLIRSTISSAVESGSRNILLNLAGVHYMDSAAGIGELVSSYMSATRQGACLKLVHANKHITHVLELTRLNAIFDLFDDEAAAIHSCVKE